MKAARQKLIKPAQDTSVVRAALAELQTALHELYGVNAPTLLLYGSYARGEASADSDVDVVLLYPRIVRPGQEISQLRAILSSLNLRYQILIAVLPASAHHYRTSATAFWKNVRREAVPVDRI
jgi:predicted nucleotidyltransferase